MIILEIIRKAQFKLLLKVRFKYIIDLLENEFDIPGREKQAEILGIEDHKIISDLLGGHREMSPGIAETISDNLRKNNIINVSSAYLLGLSDDINGNHIENNYIEEQTKIDFDLLKFINNHIGNITFVCSYSMTENEENYIEFNIFENNVMLSELYTENNKALFEYNHGRKKEKHTIKIHNVFIGEYCYSYFDFVTLYEYISKQINMEFDNFRFLFSSFNENDMNEENYIVG